MHQRVQKRLIGTREESAKRLAGTDDACQRCGIDVDQEWLGTVPVGFLFCNFMHVSFYVQICRSSYYDACLPHAADCAWTADTATKLGHKCSLR